MYYATGAGGLELKMTVKYNFMPIFYDAKEGRIRTTYRLVETGDGLSRFEWVNTDHGDAYLALQGRGGVLTVKYVGSVCGPHVSIAPSEDGFILRSGPPDPGEQPRLTPVFMLRKRLRDQELERTRSVVLPSEIATIAANAGYKALVHVGGPVFRFTVDPFRERRPFLSLSFTYDKKKTRNYLKMAMYLSRHLLHMMGIPYDRIACIDVIADIDKNIYVKLNPPGVC